MTLPPRPPQPPKPSLLQLPSRRPIHNNTLAFTRRTPAADLFAARSIPHILQQQRHRRRAQDRQAQDPYHHQRTFPILLPTLPRIARPPCEKRIRREYTAQIP